MGNLLEGISLAEAEEGILSYRRKQAESLLAVGGGDVGHVRQPVKR